MNVTSGPPHLGNSSCFWERLGNEGQLLLRNAAELVIYEPGEQLVTVGSPSETAMVIQTGWVKITSIYPGHTPDAMWLRTCGDLIGESASLGRPRIATVIAVSEVRALVLSAPRFSEFLQRYPRAQRALQETQSDRQNESDRKCIELGQTNANQRLAGLLLSLFERAGRIEGEGEVRRIFLSLPLSQKEFGQLIRASRSTVERILQEWRGRKIVITDQRSLILLNEAALRRMASPNGEAPIAPSSQKTL